MNTRIFKPLLLPLLIGLASLTAAQAQTAAQPARSTGTAAKSMNSNTLDELLGDRRADKVPTGDTGRYYLPGAAAGLDSIFPGSYSRQFRVGANFRAGLTNRCGSLDFTQNIKAEVMNLKDKLIDSVKVIQEQAMVAASGIVSGIYQYELFNLKVKQCEDYEREVRQGKNPFGEIAEIAIGEQWKTTIGKVNNGDISLEKAEKEMITEARKNGVPMADGKNYGGEGQKPINITKSLLKAGMNLTLSRGDKNAWDSDFATDEKSVKDNPILGDFKNPKELYDFVEEIYGANEITLKDSAAEPTHTNAIAGRGYERKYIEYRNEYIKLLRDYLAYNIKRNEFEKKTGQIIPPAEVDDLRLLPDYQQDVEIESRAQQYAINKVSRALLFAKQALKTGVYAPDLQQSGMKGPAETEYKNLYYRIQDDLREIRQRTYQY